MSISSKLPGFFNIGSLTDVAKAFVKTVTPGSVNFFGNSLSSAKSQNYLRNNPNTQSKYSAIFSQTAMKNVGGPSYNTSALSGLKSTETHPLAKFMLSMASGFMSFAFKGLVDHFKYKAIRFQNKSFFGLLDTEQLKANVNACINKEGNQGAEEIKDMISAYSTPQHSLEKHLDALKKINSYLQEKKETITKELEKPSLSPKDTENLRSKEGELENLIKTTISAIDVVEKTRDERDAKAAKLRAQYDVDKLQNKQKNDQKKLENTNKKLEKANVVSAQATTKANEAAIKATAARAKLGNSQ